MPRIILTGLATLAIIFLTPGCIDLLGSAAATTDGNSSGGGGGGGGATTTEADRVFELANGERTSQGLSPLARNSLLDAAGLRHAQDMRANNFFDHTGSDGSDVSVRATDAGYTWTMIGENIGMGSVSPEDMMDGWMNSPGHRANILNPDFTELGVAIDEQGPTLWVQVFGRS